MPAKFDYIGIIVKDMPKALAFYRALGWEIPAEMDGEGHVEYSLPSGLRIGWDTHGIIHSFDAEWEAPSGSHRMGLGFLCERPAEVDALYAKLVGMGYQSYKAPFDAFWGQRYAQILDPDGNMVDIFARL